MLSSTRLFHFSENPDIDVFEPRPANRNAWPDLTGTYVWSISEEMVHNYYFPRDCPRVCRMIGPQTTKTDIERFRGSGARKAIVFLESFRREEVRSCVLYRYEFDTANFRSIDSGTMYYISESREYPIDVIKITDPLKLLEEEGVMIQWVQDIRKYAQENASSSYRFSNIRMAFAGKSNRPAAE